MFLEFVKSNVGFVFALSLVVSLIIFLCCMRYYAATFVPRPSYNRRGGYYYNPESSNSPTECETDITSVPLHQLTNFAGLWTKRQDGITTAKGVKELEKVESFFQLPSAKADSSYYKFGTVSDDLTTSGYSRHSSFSQTMANNNQEVSKDKWRNWMKADISICISQPNTTNRPENALYSKTYFNRISNNVGLRFVGEFQGFRDPRMNKEVLI